MVTGGVAVQLEAVDGPAGDSRDVTGRSSSDTRPLGSTHRVRHQTRSYSAMACARRFLVGRLPAELEPYPQII
jgi:hypothetical protein